MRLNRRTFMAATAATLIAPRARAAQPIKIGVMTDFAGPYADDSGQGSVAMTKLAIEDFHKMGGGFDVEMISADFSTKPDVAASLAASWYEREGVDMIIDVPVSSAALAVANVTKQKDKVAIFGISYGGLASFIGATFTPEAFCCSVPVVGISNLPSQTTQQNYGPEKMATIVSHQHPDHD